MSAIRTEYAQGELDEIDNRIVQAFTFIRDIIDDPSLMDQFPDTPPHLRVTSAGRYPEFTPDFRTPHTDVYVVGPALSPRPESDENTQAG